MGSHVFVVIYLCSLVLTCVNLCSLVLTCVNLCSIVFNLCSLVLICLQLVFICVLLVFTRFHLCSTCVHLCSFVFICVPFVFHLCSICVHLLSRVFLLMQDLLKHLNAVELFLLQWIWFYFLLKKVSVICFFEEKHILKLFLASCQYVSTIPAKNCLLPTF